MKVLIELISFFICVCVQFSGSHVLFTGPISIFFIKIFIKTGSHVIIYTFKNYFDTVFQFSISVISGIQTDPKSSIVKDLVWFKLQIYLNVLY